ncbi:MAG TPA: TetR/AcrR family transcriptional regulator [Solirubrobacteraceae bacterium]|nr:TetR/AcrR family transcriptional regulator [Solirubrobacteraceae bacterium]
MQAVLEAAAQVFEHHGYGAATTNRIAERAGVSIGSLYQYFPNKDAILVALARQHIADSTAMLQPHLQRLGSSARWDDVLPDIVDAMVAMHALAPGLHRALFEETPLPSTLRAELDRLEDRLVDLTANALAADLGPSPVETRLPARIVVSAIEGLTHRLVLRPPPDVTPEEIAREITDLVRIYIQKHTPSANGPPTSPANGFSGAVAS